MVALLTAVHVMGVVLWIGGGLAGALLLGANEVPAAGKVVRRLAYPGMGVALLAGMGLIGIHPAYFLREVWIFAKFALAAAAVAATLSLPRASGLKKARFWGWVLAGASAGAVLLVFLKPF